jgi:hypothetical protein
MSKLKVLAVLAFSAGLMAAVHEKSGTTAVPDFEVQGIGFTQCECPGHACPCRSNAHPTNHQCLAADFAYIKRGHYGKVKLDGLKAVVVGNLLDADASKTYATAYFDQSTTPEQREAYSHMLKFMFAEGFPARVGPPRVVPIAFHESADKTEYTVSIPGILEEKAVLKRNPSGKPANTVPAMDQWGNTIHYAENVVFKYHDKEAGHEWDLSGKQANVKYFHTSKKMYDEKQLLAQHGDMSGGWNADQKKMIAKMGMKPE